MNNSTNNISATVKLSVAKIGESDVKTVNARELHAFLDSKQRFADWIKGRIDQYGFVAGVDFTDHKIMIGRNQQIDYYISIDMAKELAMVERNEKGKQARQYFIECERQAKQVDPMQVLSDPAAMRGLLLGYTEKVIKLEGQVNYLAPKAEALDRIATAGGSMCIRDAAKTLQVQEGKLAKLLVENKWIYQRPMGTGKLAYSDKLQAGLMEHKITQGNKPDGSEWVSTQPRITAKGLTKLSQMLQSPEVAA